MGKKSDKVTMRRADKIQAAADIHERMLQGESDIDIMELLGLSAEEFQIARRFLLISKGTEEASLSREERYARYLIDQDGVVQDLNSLVKNLNSKTQYNALVGALRLKADITNKKIEMGQTLGIIEKQAERKEVIVAGLQMSEVPDKDLKKAVVGVFADLRGLMERYGDGTKLSAIKPGQLHHGDAIPTNAIEASGESVTGSPEMKPPEKGKKNRAKTGKRHAGRRRVKG